MNARAPSQIHRSLLQQCIRNCYVCSLRAGPSDGGSQPVEGIVHEASPESNQAQCERSIIHSFYPRTRSMLMQASSCVSLAIPIPIVILFMPRLVPSLDAESEGHVSLASLYAAAV